MWPTRNLQAAMLGICAAASTAIAPSAATSMADLQSRGILRKHIPNAAYPGEVGSGYKSGANTAHVEPKEVWVLGTSHVSQKSAADVESAIRALQPDAVVIELCRSRTGLLYADEAPATDRAGNAFGLSGEGGPLQVLQRSLALGGWAPLLLRTLLVRLSTSVGSGLAVTPGADFRAAKRGAEQLNATLVLGDRPVEITLERSWRALSWDERGQVLRGGLQALAGADNVGSVTAAGSAADSSEMQRLVDSALGEEIAAGGDGDDRALTSARDAVAAMESALSARFPSVVEPLITERDIFLSLTIKSSMAVSGKRCVLGVVGAGHLDGVVRALGEDHQGEFKSLTWTPSRAAAKQKILGIPKPLFTRLAFDASVGLVAVWWWWWSTSAQL